MAATSTHTQEKLEAPLHIFPDGLKTAGQHPPLCDQIHPFSEFPHEITGPTVWESKEYQEYPEKWIHFFSVEEIAELDAAADAFIASRTPLTGISKVKQHCLSDYQLPEQQSLN